MAKIAAELEQALARRKAQGTPGGTSPRIVAQGDGWTVGDVLCTSGPQDRPFDEQHNRHVIAVVVAGTFQYRSVVGCGLMTPGSLMLGNHGQCFECRHDHGEGDRCVSFWFAPDYFEELAADVGTGRGVAGFSAARLPPIRALSSLVARAAIGVVSKRDTPWEELGIRLAGRAVMLAAGVSSDSYTAPSNAEARVSRTVRSIDQRLDEALTVRDLAQEARVSPYHFLRTFERVTGVTPHQYIMRARLRAAAIRLVSDAGSVLDIALDCGFGDVSNFNRAFRKDYGRSPLDYRRTTRAA